MADTPLPPGIERRPAGYLARAYDARAGRRLSRQFETLPEAKRWLADARRDIRTGKRSAKVTPTLRVAAAELVAGMESGAVTARGGKPYRPAVIRKYDQTLKRYMLEDIGSHKLADLTHASLLDQAERLRARGLAPNTVRRAFDPLRVILRRAHSRGVILSNPAHGLELPTGEVNPRDRAAGPALVAELVAAHTGARDRALWATAFYAGLRLGELRALRWRHVDLAAQRISVEQAMDDKGALGPPKTKAGVRTVPITPHLRAPLVALRGSAIPHLDAFVFGEATGQHLSYTPMRLRAAKAYTSAKLDSWTLHEARHSCISIWASAIRNPKKVMTLAGHASIAMTLQRYAKELGIDDDQTTDEIVAYLASHAG